MGPRSGAPDAEALLPAGLTGTAAGDTDALRRIAVGAGQRVAAVHAGAERCAVLAGGTALLSLAWRLTGGAGDASAVLADLIGGAAHPCPAGTPPTALTTTALA